MPEVIKTTSTIPYNYATIKITQSRIDKGLIAIPKSLAHWFPDHNDTIHVYLDNSPISHAKRYSSYNSSTRECRIGGVRQWLQQNNIKSGDEIVIQCIDRINRVYRLIPERNFIVNTKGLERSLDRSKIDQEASKKIAALCQWTNLDKNRVVLNEYYRLIHTLPFRDRPSRKKRLTRTRETAPANLRTLLKEIYKGHCQVCDFWFLKKDGEPYFEIHHVNPIKNHHPKNLLVVCGNCHNQFEHANVKPRFDGGWLVEVTFNNTISSVKQIALITKIEPHVKEVFI